MGHCKHGRYESEVRGQQLARTYYDKSELVVTEELDEGGLEVLAAGFSISYENHKISGVS